MAIRLTEPTNGTISERTKVPLAIVAALMIGAWPIVWWAATQTSKLNNVLDATARLETRAQRVDEKLLELSAALGPKQTAAPQNAQPKP